MGKKKNKNKNIKKIILDMLIKNLFNESLNNISKFKALYEQDVWLINIIVE